jgi:hypothetical protein
MEIPPISLVSTNSIAKILSDYNGQSAEKLVSVALIRNEEEQC